MKKILIAIAAVFCAQIAFQTYLAVERTDNDFAKLTTPLTGSVTNNGQMLADLTVHEPAQIDVPTVIRTRYIVKVEKSQPVYATDRRPTQRETQPTVAAFKPVIITAKVTQPIAVADKVERSEKRSFPSKAVAVIKKPYDWLKAVASKLR